MKQHIDEASRHDTAGQHQTYKPAHRTAVIYARGRIVGSADVSGQEGRAVRQQLKHCREAARHLDGSVVQEFIDVGSSASNSSRPGFRALLERVKGRDVDYVIVAGLDRLARHLADQLTVIEAFEAAGARLLIANQQGGSPVSPAAELTQAVLNIVHRLAHEERSRAAKQGWANRRAKQVAR
jgi:DNA invertase Pin-like site-specific DNA recombinase